VKQAWCKSKELGILFVKDSRRENRDEIFRILRFRSVYPFQPSHILKNSEGIVFSKIEEMTKLAARNTIGKRNY